MIKKKQLNKYEENIYCDECDTEMYLFGIVDSNRRSYTPSSYDLRVVRNIIMYEPDYIYKCPRCEKEKITEERYPKIIEE